MVKSTPKKVFVLENGNYIEITYDEVCSNEKYKDRLFLSLHGMLLEVTKKDYDAFYKARRREKYINERIVDKKDIYYSILDTDEFNGEDIVIDKKSNVEEAVEKIFDKEKIYEFIETLSEKDRELIVALYFQELTEREYAKQKGIYHNAVHDRKKKILNNLKNFLEKFK